MYPASDLKAGKRLHTEPIQAREHDRGLEACTERRRYDVLGNLATAVRLLA